MLKHSKGLIEHLQLQPATADDVDAAKHMEFAEQTAAHSRVESRIGIKSGSIFDRTQAYSGEINNERSIVTASSVNRKHGIAVNPDLQQKRHRLLSNLSHLKNAR